MLTTFFLATWCYFVFIYYYLIMLPQIFFSLSFLATCHNSFFSPPHFRQLGCHNPFFSLLTPLKFQQLGCHNWFFPFEYFYFGHLINLGSQIRVKGISITSLSKFNSFLTSLSHHFSLISHPFFVRILATGLPKFASLLNFLNNFK